MTKTIVKNTIVKNTIVKNTKKTNKIKKTSSVFNFNNLFNTNNKSQSNTNNISQSNTHTKQSLKKKLSKLQDEYNLKKNKEIVNSYYSLNNPITSYLIKYNDNESKKLINNGFDNLGLVQSYPFPEIDEQIKSIDIVYNQHKELLKELKLKDITPIIKYSSEDLTRGIRTYLDNRFKDLPINLSNGFVKLWEILHTFNLMNETKCMNHTQSQTKLIQNRSFNVLHIAEAPGQMILCAKYYAEKKNSNITNYEWRANSLNPFNNEVKQHFSALKDNYKLMKNNPTKWLWGADNTGDITRVKNIKWIRNYINNKWLKNKWIINKDTNTNEEQLKKEQIKKEQVKLDLIIGDGGMGADTNSSYDLQKLDLAQVINVLAYSSIYGSCVIKHFTPYMINKPESIEATSFFISFIYLYYIAFEEVSLYKPYTSDITSGEFYIICKGFKGIDDTIINKLYTILNNFKVNKALFTKDTMPSTFIIQMLTFITLLTKYNIKGYEKQNYLLECYKNNKLVKKLKKTYTTKTSHLFKLSQTSQFKSTKNKTNCNYFLNEKEIETILIPRYNQWINLFEFE